ncbi:hypothetical protein SAMN06265795_11959 [Noviherbaspirillum humi]|uniref:Uncharacterized protein n=1 Tax=Noviherbaspirillum humi TaxID=1688639 RepID=A0A239L4E3_9BURK|nr:hypothetical protein [Noviherbaspirillum humi]SNT25477.1 hypothetical protein SAMN06265795_11959 [Noviherbaspirillum humi]
MIQSHARRFTLTRLKLNRLPLWLMFAVGLLIGAIGHGGYRARSELLALQIVEQHRLGDTLPRAARVLARSQQSFGMLQRRSAERADALLDNELQRLRPTYQDRWNRFLAQTYAAHFSGDELRSLAEQQDASPYFLKFVASRNLVIDGMTQRAAALLDDYAMHAAEAALAHAGADR